MENVPSDDLESSKCVFGDEGSKVKVGVVLPNSLVIFIGFEKRYRF